MMTKALALFLLLLLFSGFVSAVEFVKLTNCEHKVKSSYKYRYCDIVIDGKSSGLIVIKEGIDFYGPFGMVGGYFNFAGRIVANNVDKKQAFIAYRPQGNGLVIHTACGSKYINSRYVEDAILEGFKCAELLNGRK